MAISESAADYLEAILVLQSETKAVRLKDISRKLGVSMPSVHGALHLLEDAKMVNHERYGYIELTEKGQSAARDIYAAHTSLVSFLVHVLGVAPATAEEEACRMEHVLSEGTLRKISTFTEEVLRRESDVSH